MWYVDPNMPLPIDIGNAIISEANFYINEDFGYPREYCYYTRIKAIEKIIEIEEKLSPIQYCVRSIWCPSNYHLLPIEIRVYWDKNHNLINSKTRKHVTSEIIFNTELEAVQYVIDHPDPIFLMRKKELLDG